jgi:hypothetical protein
MQPGFSPKKSKVCRYQILLALGSDGLKALAIEIDEMFRVGGDEFHHFEGNFFVATQRRSSRSGIDGSVTHGIFSKAEMKKTPCRLSERRRGADDIRYDA